MTSHITPTAIVISVGAAVFGATLVNAQSAATPESRITAAAAAGNLNQVVAALIAEGLTPDAVALALTAANVPTTTAALALKAANVPADVVVSVLVAAAPTDQKGNVSIVATLAASPTGAGQTGGVIGSTAAGAPVSFTGPTGGGGGGSGTATKS
jgi:hypothetical protein